MLAQNGVSADIDLVNFKILKFIAAVGAAAEAEGKSEGNPTMGQPTGG